MSLLDAGTLKPLGLPLPDTSTVEDLAFSPDGHTLATSNANGVVRLWQGFLWRDFADLKQQVCSLVVGNVSRDDWRDLAPGLAYRTTCSG